MLGGAPVVRPHRVMHGRCRFSPGWPLRPWWYELLVLVGHQVLRGLLSGIEGCLVGLILKIPAGRALDPGVQSGRPGQLDGLTSLLSNLIRKWVGGGPRSFQAAPEELSEPGAQLICIYLLN